MKFLLTHTLISFVAQHLCIRTNLICDPLKQNKQSFSVHTLVVIAWVCLLNGQIYLTFHETRQLGRKWHSWLYMGKNPFLFLLKFLQSKDLNQTSCFFVCEDTSLTLAGQPWLPPQSSVMKQHCLFSNERYIVRLHHVGRRVGPKEYAHIIQINVLVQMWLVGQISKRLLLVQGHVSFFARRFVTEPSWTSSFQKCNFIFLRVTDYKELRCEAQYFFLFSKED